MDKQLAKKIGAAAKLARKDKGLTQAQVAELIDVTTEFYSRLERGVTMPSLGTLYKLAESLEMSADELLGDPRNLVGKTE